MNSGKPVVVRTQRLFFALWPDDATRGQLAAHANQWIWPPGCARYAPADWHATLHFIGDVATEQVEAIAACAAVPLQPFDLVLDQPRLWPHGLAVLCASEIPAALRDLHARLGQALRGLELALDTRPFVPHVTLARHADAAGPPTVVLPVRWQVRGFALVVSTGLKAPRYQVIRQYSERYHPV
ncbi:MAG TPA: RNA 2',3'-cyclic phosphodiesterase [Rhodoferax sp.]|nr:RNA 2',3'-cyclic phosphodiesterase [Rhodoferax sp.]